jgi:hypothetical protein
MRANVDAIAQQETDMAGFIAESKETFIDGLEKGIANEWVSPKAAGLKDKVIASPVRVYDWMTIAQNNDEFGRYDYATNMTLLSQGLGTSAEARNADFMEKHHETLPHEWWHGFDLSHEELPYDIGWLVEAGAEHCAQSFRYGSPDVIDPNDRGETAPVLGGCRALAAEMMNGLDTALFTRAVTSGSTRTAEWQAFTQAVDKKYGMNDAIRHISDRQVDYWYMCHDGQKDRTEVTRQAALAVRDELHEEPWKVAGTFVPVANTGTFVAEPLTERNRN